MNIKMTTDDIEVTTTRDATENEQNILLQTLSSLPISRKRYLKAALNTAVFWVFISFALCVFWFVISLMVAGFFNLDVGVNSVYASYLFPLLLVIAAYFSLYSTRNWLRSSIDEHALIKADLKAKKTFIETYQVVAAKSFKEPKFGGLLYFLQLQKSDSSEQKIKAIYDYESQSDDSNPNKLLSIKQEFILCSAPASGFVFEHQFKGNSINQIIEYDLTLSPEEWPEPNSWQDVDWNALASLYNPK